MSPLCLKPPGPPSLGIAPGPRYLAEMDDKPLSELRIDPSQRPKAPRLEGVTDAQRQQGRHLAAIHNAHREEMRRIRVVLDAIEAGREDPSTLPTLILKMDMRQNFQTFGNLCGRECRMLAFHHHMEESHMFPELEEKAGGPFVAIVKRLREEHEIVHALIERLYGAAVNVVNDPSDETFATTRETFEALDEVVRSHFGYEEAELEEAIGVFLDGI